MVTFQIQPFLSKVTFLIQPSLFMFTFLIQPLLYGHVSNVATSFYGHLSNMATSLHGHLSNTATSLHGHLSNTATSLYGHLSNTATFHHGHLTNKATLQFALIVPCRMLCRLQAVEELLGHGVDASQRLSHGVGSALCVASSTEFEHRRTPEARIRLVSLTCECFRRFSLGKLRDHLFCY